VGITDNSFELGCHLKPLASTFVVDPKGCILKEAKIVYDPTQKEMLIIEGKHKWFHENVRIISFTYHSCCY